MVIILLLMIYNFLIIKECKMTSALGNYKWGIMEVAVMTEKQNLKNGSRSLHLIHVLRKII
jgi:hypothetical protein